MRIKLLSGFLLSFICVQLSAQLPDTLNAKKQIHIIKAARFNFEQADPANQLQSLAGGVIVQQENTTFYCDSAVLNSTTNVLEAFGHVHINDADSVHTYADYLKYVGNEKKAYLRRNVRLTDGRGTLTTSDLVYDVSTKIATYANGGKVVNSKTTLTSEEGLYYGDTRDIYFKKKVRLKDPDFNISTDTLLYNTFTERATFVAPTTIVNGKRKIITREGYYDLKTKKSYFGKRSTIIDSTTILIADEVAYDDSSGFGEARGNVIWRDSTQGFTMIANNIKVNRTDASLLATINPVLILKQEGDSILVAADTLTSGKLTDLINKRKRKVNAIDSVSNFNDPALSKDSNRNRYFEAYRNVKIFSDSLQAVGDSLMYTGVDSAFRLFYDPIVWARDNQITGDTIYLFTKNKKPELLKVFENALAISKVSSIYYNQVKGRTITGYFKNGDISLFRAKGVAEVVYYTQDEENKFIGVNKTKADLVNVVFENKKPQRVSFVKDASGKLYPMKQVDHEEIRLRGFKIQEDRRPKTKFDLFGK